MTVETKYRLEEILKCAGYKIQKLQRERYTGNIELVLSLNRGEVNPKWKFRPEARYDVRENGT